MSRLEKITEKLEEKLSSLTPKVENVLYKMEKSWFVKKINSYLLKKTFNGMSDDLLTGYDHAFKGDLEKALTVFNRNSYKEGMLFVADKYLKKVEDKLKADPSTPRTDVESMALKPYSIYLKLGGGDANILRVSNLYRKAGNDKKALSIEDKQKKACTMKFNYRSSNHGKNLTTLVPEERQRLVKSNIEHCMNQ